jgi:hypothetical protein
MKSLKVWKKKVKTGLKEVRTGDHGKHLCTGNVLTTGPSDTWCWKSGNQTLLSDYVSLEFEIQTQSASGPRHLRRNESECAISPRQLPRRSTKSATPELGLRSSSPMRHDLNLQKYED